MRQTGRMGDGPIDLRVGDRERRAVDEQLQAAVGDGVLTLAEYDERSAALWQTRTRTELDELVRDLPDSAPQTPAAARADVRPQRVVAVMSEDRFFAPVRPGQEVRGWAVMGKAVLDLRREDLPSGTHVRVRAVMGEVEVQVPPGSTVHLSGMTLMGERKVEVHPGPGPQLHVDAYAVMGAVKVTVGDGRVVATGAPSSTPAPQRPTEVERGRPGVLARGLRRIAGLAVPLAIVGAVVVAGPDSTSIFGSSVERVQPGQDSVRVSTLFGSVAVVVPDDVQVDTGGLVVFGSVSCEQACQAKDGLHTTAQVTAVGGFGSVSVYTQSEYEQRREAGRLEDERDERDD